jgi:hypothetical protein
MYKRWTTTLALLVLLFAPVALAQDHQEIRGTVTAKTESTLTIETVKGQLVSFGIIEQSLLPPNLSVGDKVAIHHHVGVGDGGLQPITEVLIADEFQTLPQTASPLAALAVAGLASLLGARGLRRRRS